MSEESTPAPTEGESSAPLPAASESANAPASAPPAAKPKRRLLRWAMYGAIGLVFVIVIGAGSIYAIASSKINSVHEVTVTAVDLPTDAESLAKGKYMVEAVLGCTECHGENLAGKAVIDAQPMGLVYAPNITPGNGSVTTQYTTVDWLRTIRHGIKPNGKPLILMPSEDYYFFSDAEIGAVIAYLKSLPPVDAESKSCALGPVGTMLIATGGMEFAVNKIDHSASRQAVPPGPTREYGAVLVNVCTGCHGLGLSGGWIPGGDPAWPKARNITPDKATGIGNWTEADFKKAMQTGVRPDGTAIDPVMPWKMFAKMSDDDLHAIWLYLQTVQPKPADNR